MISSQGIFPWQSVSVSPKLMYALAEPQLMKCTFSDRRLVRLASDEGAVRANNLFENIGKAETKLAT